MKLSGAMNRSRRSGTHCCWAAGLSASNPAASALAQNNQNNQENQQNQGSPTQPFQPLPPAQPTPAPTAEPEDDGGFLDQDIGGSATLYIIAAGLLVAFIFIGMFISRDAKRSLPKIETPHSPSRWL